MQLCVYVQKNILLMSADERAKIHFGRKKKLFTSWNTKSKLLSNDQFTQWDPLAYQYIINVGMWEVFSFLSLLHWCILSVMQQLHLQP